MYVGGFPEKSCIRYVNCDGRVSMTLACLPERNTTSGSARPTVGRHVTARTTLRCPVCGARMRLSRHGLRCPDLRDTDRATQMAPFGISRTLTADTEDADECVEKYQNHFSWLRDPKFLQQLENDSIDSDIIEEELSALQEEEVAISKRKRVVKFLQSNPVQILLCVVVLLDAVIVIAQILLDLNSVKLKLTVREQQLGRFVSLARASWPDELRGYGDQNYDQILQILEHHLCDNGTGPDGADPETTPDSGSARIRLERPIRPSGWSRDRHGAAERERRSSTRKREETSGLVDCSQSYHRGESRDLVQLGHEGAEKHDVLREAAHGLHFASLAMLGFLVLEDLIKIVAMGSDFFRHKTEIFDAIIILSSFLFDIIFLGGMTGEEGQKAAAVLIILLLWRIARVVDGIMVTVKQRQEFRIRLQKRSRRNAERKIDMLEDERHCRVREIHSLKELCLKAGVKEEEIEACTPRRPHRVSTTMCALSSVARLSVSMTMSMSSGLFSMADDDVDKTGDDTSGKPGRLEHRRYSREMSTDGHEVASSSSPKLGKKRANQQPPASPKAACSAHAQDAAYLPKLDESSLEGATEREEGGGTRASSPTAGAGASSGSEDGDRDSSAIRTGDDGGRTIHDEETRTSSPENSSGIQIVIDEGSDADSSCSREGGATEQRSGTYPERDSHLTVEAAFDHDRRSSASSQVFLLGELR